MKGKVYPEGKTKMNEKEAKVQRKKSRIFSEGLLMGLTINGLEVVSKANLSKQSSSIKLYISNDLYLKIKASDDLYLMSFNFLYRGKSYSIDGRFKAKLQWQPSTNRIEYFANFYTYGFTVNMNKENKDLAKSIHELPASMRKYILEGR